MCRWLCAVLIFVCSALALRGQATALATHPAARKHARIFDLSFHSRVFGEERSIRVFLPPDYDASKKRYPVVYFFHGWGERFNRPGEDPGNYDTGYGGDNFTSYVGSHDLILVKWDGYNPRTPGENYARPYNIGPVETNRQFPLFFPELVEYVDAHFRTIAGRDHRAVSGLSMGGFMSFWVAGKYPHMVGSASNFMGSAEFVVGPKEAPVEYLHTPMYMNYEGVRTRLVTGTEDFIRWYHRRMNAVWLYTRPYHETESFPSRHGTPGVARTLDFHMRAFGDPLPKPALWHHADVYPSFDVWGYSVQSDRKRPGFTVLENVSRSGFRSSVREFLSGGPYLPDVKLDITTDAIYVRGGRYTITDFDVQRGRALTCVQSADARGRLHFTLNGAQHEIGIAAGKAPIIAISGWELKDAALPLAGSTVAIRLHILNKGTAPADGLVLRVASPNPGVVINTPELHLPHEIRAGASLVSEDVRFNVDDASREIVRLLVGGNPRRACPGAVRHSHSRTAVKSAGAQRQEKATSSGGGGCDVCAGAETRAGHECPIAVDVPLFPNVGEMSDVTISDGRELRVWENAINARMKTLGVGNGDGQANPGETIAVLWRDREAYRAAELFSFDSCVDSAATASSGAQHVPARLSDYWGDYDHVGASAKISLPAISASCPQGHEIVFFARFLLPNAPEHMLKQGIVRVRVSDLSEH